MIQGNFSNGNIEVLGSTEAKSTDNPLVIRLRIRKDSTCYKTRTSLPDYMRQWFHFTLQGKVGTKYRLIIEDIDNIFIPKGWDNYKAKASYDNNEWFEVAETNLGDKNLSIEITLKQEKITFAYFRPFAPQQHAQLIELITKTSTSNPLCNVEKLGKTIEGRDINLITIGKEDPNKLKIWIIAGQHPGEPQGSWFTKGLIEALLQIKTESDAKSEIKTDPRFSELLNNVVFYIVPCMNPDGLARGNLRFNAMGKDQNRSWAATDKELKEHSSEILAIRNAMHGKGVDFLLDVHGDEAAEKAFFQPATLDSNNQLANSKTKEIQISFMKLLASQHKKVDADLRYDNAITGQNLKGLATEFISNNFLCPAIVLEMPYKSWSAEMAMQLGHKTLLVFCQIQSALSQSRSQITLPQKSEIDSSPPRCILM